MRNTTREAAFTLTEVLFAMSVLAILVLVFSQLFNAATAVITRDSRRIDVEQQIRPLTDRIVIDIARMLKRTDIDYYLKTPANTQSGNDQLAFFSSVPGYYPETGARSPVSVVAYRTALGTGFERMAKGLVWNGASGTGLPIVFLPVTIATNWPSATDDTADPDYEPMAPHVFRFEYCYVLRDGTLTDAPWNAAAGSTAVNGLKDVHSIRMTFAVLASTTKALLSEDQLATLRDSLIDFEDLSASPELFRDWQETVRATTDMPQVALSSIRIYERYFPLTP